MYLILFVLWLLPNVYFRARSAVVAYKVHRILHRMSSFHVGRTTEAEALDALPMLRLNDLQICNAAKGENCFLYVNDHTAAGISDGWLTWAKLSDWLGNRSWLFNAQAKTKNHIVQEFGYKFFVNDGSYGWWSDQRAQAMSSGPSKGVIWDFLSDQSPEYDVGRGRRAPSSVIGMFFTANATREQVQHAFDLRLRCMIWTGCRTADQLAPSAAQDEAAIYRAAMARRRGPDPCPDALIPGRARHLSDIRIVRVIRSDRVGEDRDECLGCVIERKIVLQTLKHLKGTDESRELTISLPFDDPGTRKPDPQIKWLLPGRELIWFSDTDMRIQDCEFIPSTKQAVDMIESQVKDQKASDP